MSIGDPERRLAPNAVPIPAVDIVKYSVNSKSWKFRPGDKFR